MNPMKQNVFKTATGKYLLEQMFEKSWMLKA